MILLNNIKYFFYGASIIIMLFFSVLINHFLTIPNTEWVNNNPLILNISSTTITVEFSVTQPSVIYWRIYPEAIKTPTPASMTNIFDMEYVKDYGGGIIDKSNKKYVKTINDLEASTSYKLVALAVSKIGTFPKEIKEISFKTKPQ